MGNAGNSNDKRILEKMIIGGFLLRINFTDSQLPGMIQIKNRFNSIVRKDIVVNMKYNGKSYKQHTAWQKIYPAILWTNQKRFKHFMFEPLSEKDFYNPNRKLL